MDKTALITGATAGFGKACAKLFALDGYKLILTGRREKILEKLKDELKSKTDILTLKMDVRVKDKVFAQIKNLPNKFKDIDVLVNNAGLALGLDPAHKADIKDWEQMIDTNINGLIYLTRAVLPGMVKRKRGHIVNIGSISGTYPYLGCNTYGATKAFVRQFSRNLRCDLPGTGINVTNIEPGLARTEFSQVRFHGDKKKAAMVYEEIMPLMPDDIAETILWSVSRPAHVNINNIEIMPACQVAGPPVIHKSQ